MTRNETNVAMNWLKNNIITLVVLASGMLLAWAALSARVEAIEAKVQQYPSQDWFELKFQQVDEKLQENKNATDRNAAAIQALPQVVKEVVE